MHAHQILTALLALGLTVSLAPVAWQAYGPNGHQRKVKHKGGGTYATHR